MSITLETVLSRNNDILHAPVNPEEAVMLSISAGRYYGLNAVAARIWELLETPKTTAELCTRLCAEFEVEAPACEHDVLKFVDQLVANRIVDAAPA